MSMAADLQRNLIERVAVGDLLRRRARDSAAVEGFIDYGSGARVAWTYAAINARVNRLVRGLRGLGLKQGDRIGLICGNGIDFLTVQFASFKAGTVLVPINYAQSAADVAWTLNHAGVSAVVVEQPLRAGFAAVDPELSATVIRIMAGAAPQAGMLTLESLMAGQSEAEIDDVLIGDRDTVQIMYTSGTTARPKGVMSGHLALVMAAFSNAIGYGYVKPYCALNVLPQFHIAAEVGQLMTMVLGGRLVSLRGFDAARVVELRYAEALGIAHVITKDAGALFKGEGGAEEVQFSVKNVITQDQGGSGSGEEFLRQQEGLGDAFRRGLFLVGQADAEIFPVAEEVFKSWEILRSGDDEDILDAAQHEGGQRVINHRFVVDREQLFARDTGERVEPGARPTCEDDAFFSHDWKIAGPSGPGKDEARV